MLLDRADRDIYNAKLLLSPEGNPTNDELLDDMAAYHVQQAIENQLKLAANDITSWEANSRYDDSPVSAREEIS